jgi:hypothetical protein
MTLPCTDSAQVIARLHQCWNTHDLDGLVACFHPDYQSLQPFHPDRNFTGLASLRARWRAVFESLANFEAELKRGAVMDQVVWTEWRWHGCHTSGVLYESVGVVIFELAGDLIRRATIYSEVLANEGPDWDSVLNDLLGEHNDQ